jgi:sugar/nucleoside kinase (ribokinase family)
MKSIKQPDKRPRKPCITALGLVAFDYVVDSTNKRLHVQAGGTCGNVAAILSALGWHAVPIARLKEDLIGVQIRSDLERFGADTKWLSCRPDAESPVIVERLLRDPHGIPFHVFSFSCPGCGGRLPRFQPVTITALRSIISDAARADVVFIDRFSPAAVTLAEAARGAGSLVYFEPSTAISSRELERMLQFTNILKYSHERIDDTGTVLPEDVFLEIQTLGRGGLRYRRRSRATRRMKEWVHVNSRPVENLVDSTGAGDWFSAALIHILAKHGFGAARDISDVDLLEALSKAQALGAWSCGFVGARGAMYQVPLENIERVLAAAKSHIPTQYGPVYMADGSMATICEICASSRQDEEWLGRDDHPKQPTA